MAGYQPLQPMVQSNAFVPPSLTTRHTGIMPVPPHRVYRPYPDPPLTGGDVCLWVERLQWETLVNNGGLKAICCPRGRKPYSNRPWIDMPRGGRRFKPISTLPVTGLFDGADHVVMSERVPLGYDGVIADIVCEVVAPGATGFVEGSGDVTWRLAADNRYLRDQGNLTVTVGSLTTPSSIPRGGLLVYSHNLIQFFVNLAPAAIGNINPNARIVCSITGWWWPR